MAEPLLPRLKLPETLPAGRMGTSAVLILIGVDENEQKIVLTKRTDIVETHKGQVSFPGGFWEPQDTSLLDTALREAKEEIGVISSDVEVLGALDPVYTRGSVLIQPWVARLKLPYPFKINDSEVAKMLMLPLAQLLNDGLKEVDVAVGSLNIKSPGIFIREELVWGATARILEQLRRCF